MIYDINNNVSSIDTVHAYKLFVATGNLDEPNYRIVAVSDNVKQINKLFDKKVNEFVNNCVHSHTYSISSQMMCIITDKEENVIKKFDSRYDF